MIDLGLRQPSEGEGGAALRGLAYVISRWLLNRTYLIAEIPDLDLRFKFRTRDAIGRHLYKYRRHEPEVTAFLRRHLDFLPGDVVVDIGANLGWYSLLAEQLAPRSVSIYAFEPDPGNFELLTENLRINRSRQVTPVEQGVAARSGILELHRYKQGNLGRHSILPINAGEKISVSMTTLDQFWAERGLEGRRLRFIKIDVEGYELMALRGGCRVLAQCPLLLAEYSPQYMRSGGLRPGELVEYLVDLAFQPHILRGGRLHPIDPAELADSERQIEVFWCRPGEWLRRVAVSAM
jgi:FkbM family methyltransferase